jgi:hypothetical protein
MALSDLIAGCLDLAYDADYGAASAVHETAEGVETTCTAVVESSEVDEYRGADDLGATARIRLRASEVATVAAGDTVTIGTLVYEVLWARLSSDGGEWVSDCALR